MKIFRVILGLLSVKEAPIYRRYLNSPFHTIKSPMVVLHNGARRKDKPLSRLLIWSAAFRGEVDGEDREEKDDVGEVA